MSRPSFPIRATVSCNWRRFWCHVVIACISISVTYLGPASSQVSERALLNSERIASRFGSYGIEVLKSNDQVRVSNLYSIHGGRRITRTLAVVEYPMVVAGAFATEHEIILAGGSIGSTFSAAGWRVIKHNRAYTEVPASLALAMLMGIEAERPLATHAYVLEIQKGDMHFEYASIAEMHNPEYLAIEDLRRIYGAIPALSTEQSERVADLLEIARTKIRELVD